MKAQEFRTLVEQLGDLSAVQRDAIIAALTSGGSANEVTALIETRFAAAPTCGHCKSEIISSWGRDGSKATRLKRYMCKSCGRTFNALTGTPLAQLHRRDAWLNYARALVDRVSLRKAAVPPTSAWKPRSAGAIVFCRPPKTSAPRWSLASSKPTRHSS